MIASIHAQQRAAERAHGADLADLWQLARDAGNADYEAFRVYFVVGYRYRVARWCGEDYMLVACGDVLITIRQRAEVSGRF